MCQNWELFSGKFAVAAKLLERLRSTTTDRIVIVSNFTQTLDLFTQLCRDKNVCSSKSLGLGFSTSILALTFQLEQFS